MLAPACLGERGAASGRCRPGLVPGEWSALSIRSVAPVRRAGARSRSGLPGPEPRRRHPSFEVPPEEKSGEPLGMLDGSGDAVRCRIPVLRRSCAGAVETGENPGTGVPPGGASCRGRRRKNARPGSGRRSVQDARHAIPDRTAAPRAHLQSPEQFRDSEPGARIRKAPGSR